MIDNWHRDDGTDIRDSPGGRYCTKIYEHSYAPPDEMRCKTIKRGSGERCRKFKVRGGDYCYYHAGKHKRDNRNSKRPVKFSALPVFYRKFISKSLAEALDSLMDGSPAEQLALFDELGMMRSYAGNLVAMYSMVYERLHTLPSDTPEAKKKEIHEDLLRVSLMMKDAMYDVARIAKLASDVEAAAKDKVSLLQLKHYTDQMTRCAYMAAEKQFGTEPAKAEQFARDFNDFILQHVRIPKIDGETGEPISKLPSDVDAMDATIPIAVEQPANG